MVRTARTTRDREQEARLRIGCLQNWLCNKDLGPRATEAVQRLHAGEAELEGRGPRRRYPPVGKEEGRRLEQSVREWAHG